MEICVDLVACALTLTLTVENPGRWERQKFMHWVISVDRPIGEGVLIRCPHSRFEMLSIAITALQRKVAVLGRGGHKTIIRSTGASLHITTLQML